MATYWENSCSFGLRYVSWYKCLIVSLVFSHLGFWSGNLFLIAHFPDLCLLVPFYTLYKYAKIRKRRNQKEIPTPKTEVGKNQTNNQAYNNEYIGNCAVKQRGAWWHWWHSYSNLNGVYHLSASAPDRTGIYWRSWHIIMSTLATVL